MEFQAFSKIARYNRDIIITEKLDGTNAAVFVGDDGTVGAQSRNRIITSTDDNHGFAKWVEVHANELRGLGPGYHFGEWWGSGVNLAYGLMKGDKRFSLFNVRRWADADPLPPEPMNPAHAANIGGPTERRSRPACCGVVPVLYAGPHREEAIRDALTDLRTKGSRAVPGFMRPEGIVIFHTASNALFKITCLKDDKPKGIAA